jgi:gas vesicle protein
METAKEFARNLPSADEIIRALGLRTQQSSHMSSIALFGAGVLVGAGLALLFAPTSGRELRDELGERASEARDRVTDMAEQGASSFTRQGQQTPRPTTY